MREAREVGHKVPGGLHRRVWETREWASCEDMAVMTPSGRWDAVMTGLSLDHGEKPLSGPGFDTRLPQLRSRERSCRRQYTVSATAGVFPPCASFRPRTFRINA